MKYRAIGENHLYNKVYAKGNKAVTHSCVVYCLKDYHAARLQKENPLKLRINRIGLTVTKKIGCAVVRTRVKRILREGYRQLDQTHPIKKGFLVVLVARDAAVEMKTQQIYTDLFYAFRKLEMLEGMPFTQKTAKNHPRQSPAVSTDSAEKIPAKMASSEARAFETASAKTVPIETKKDQKSDR